MKLKILLACAVCAGLLTASAQVPTAEVNTNAIVAPELKPAIISFSQNVSTAREVTVAIYPSYAPGIVKGDGQFGVGVAAIYPIAPNATSGHLYSGLRLDYIGHSWSAATIGIGVKADMQVIGHNITFFSTASVLMPINGTGSGEVGALIGAGVSTALWQSPNKKWTVSAFIQSEYSTQFNSQIWHGGPHVNFKF